MFTYNKKSNPLGYILVVQRKKKIETQWFKTIGHSQAINTNKDI